MRHIAETESGVYQPMSIRVATILPLLGILAITLLALTGNIPLTPALPLFIGFIAVSLMPILFERWKYGRLGKPAIALRAGALTIGLPNDSRGHISVPLGGIQEIIVYGPEGRRYYRIVHKDGTFVEVVPQWSKAVDEAVIRFFQGRLASVVKVTIKEPQSVFAYIRGDRP